MITARTSPKQLPKLCRVSRKAIELTNETIGDGGAHIMYRFTDIYGNAYWTPVIEN